MFRGRLYCGDRGSSVWAIVPTRERTCRQRWSPAAGSRSSASESRARKNPLLSPCLSLSGFRLGRRRPPRCLQVSSSVSFASSGQKARKRRKTSEKAAASKEAGLSWVSCCLRLTLCLQVLQEHTWWWHDVAPPRFQCKHGRTTCRIWSLSGGLFLLGPPVHRMQTLRRRRSPSLQLHPSRFQPHQDRLRFRSKALRRRCRGSVDQDSQAG